MTTRKSCVLVCLLFLGLMAVAVSNSAAAAGRRPNVLLILADDLGYSDLGCYGGEIPTPNLDRLAAGGVRYSAFYTSARCCPTRASLMTGLHPHQAGIGSFVTPKPEPGKGPAHTGHLLPTCVTLAEMLGDAGYTTWMVGKWHLGTPGPIARGFQQYYGYRDFGSHSENQWDPSRYVRLPQGTAPELSPAAGQFYATEVFTDYALEFLRQARQARPREGAVPPWFLYLAHSSPHFPVQAPKASIDRHMATYRRGWDVLRAERFARLKQLGLVARDAALPPRELVPVDRADIANGYSGQPNPAWDTLPADRREDLARRMATFAAMVEHLDQGVGRILADLEKHQELANTLILFLSDNGACYEWGPFGFDGVSRAGSNTLHRGAELETMGQNHTHSSYGSAWASLGNTPLRWYKHFCHEGGIADPLVLHWPEGVQRRGGWSHDPVHAMDVVPTVLAAAGAAYPARRGGETITPVEGVSLLPTLAGQALPERDLAFEHQEARALRRGEWKIAWGKRMTNEPAWELYNLRADRLEQHDLAAAQPERVRSLAEAWMTWAKRVQVFPFFAGADTNAVLASKAAPARPAVPPGYGTAPGRLPELQIPAKTKPLLEVWMRDTWVSRGPDGCYYLTGTTAAPRRRFDTNGPQCWDWNDGLYLWRSKDLKKWKALGCVWSLDRDATWQSVFAQASEGAHPTGYRMEVRRRAVWAPELHYIRSATNWFLVACMSDASPQKGSFVLRSRSGRPEGPYENIAGNRSGPLYPSMFG